MGPTHEGLTEMIKSYTNKHPTTKGGNGCGRRDLAELTATQVTITLGSQFCPVGAWKRKLFQWLTSSTAPKECCSGPECTTQEGCLLKSERHSCGQGGIQFALLPPSLQVSRQRPDNKLLDNKLLWSQPTMNYSQMWSGPQVSESNLGLEEHRSNSKEKQIKATGRKRPTTAKRFLCGWKRPAP